MNGVSLTPTQLLAGLGVLLSILWVSRAAVWRARRAAAVARQSSRLLSLTGRVLITAALIVGVQWAVIALHTDTTVLLIALGLPALFAAYTLVRALTVPSFDSHRRLGGGWW